MIYNMIDSIEIHNSLGQTCEWTTPQAHIIPKSTISFVNRFVYILRDDKFHNDLESVKMKCPIGIHSVAMNTNIISIVDINFMEYVGGKCENF